MLAATARPREREKATEPGRARKASLLGVAAIVMAREGLSLFFDFFSPAAIRRPTGYREWWRGRLENETNQSSDLVLINWETACLEHNINCHKTTTVGADNVQNKVRVKISRPLEAPRYPASGLSYQARDFIGQTLCRLPSITLLVKRRRRMTMG